MVVTVVAGLASLPTKRFQKKAADRLALVSVVPKSVQPDGVVKEVDAL